MIELEHVRKCYPTRHGQAEILQDVNLQVERGEKISILGGNGSGKSTLIRLIGGVERPTSGTVTRTMRVSWPLAFSGTFQGSLTGIDNARFICRIYEIDIETVIDFIEDFTELGRYLKEPVKSYSSGMRARLAFALSMSVEFDCYLIDEIAAVGDTRFQHRCNDELFVRRSDRALIIVSHDSHYLRAHCSRGAVLAGGRLHHFDEIEPAIEFHEHNMAQ